MTRTVTAVSLSSGRNGGRPEIISQRMAPSAYTSAAAPTSRLVPFACSRRHVSGRADDRARKGERGVALEAFRNSEIGHLRHAFGIEEHIRRLHVAMDDAVLMREMQARATLINNCAASRGGIIPVRSRFASEPLSTYSIEKNGAPLSSPTS